MAAGAGETGTSGRNTALHECLVACRCADPENKRAPVFEVLLHGHVAATSPPAVRDPAFIRTSVRSPTTPAARRRRPDDRFVNRSDPPLRATWTSRRRSRHVW